MGCDIHLHIEIKINDEWHHYNTRSLRRNYDLFGRMAGVRSLEVVPIATPRGLPKDATMMTFFDATHWGRDAHTFSWLSSQEVAELELWVNGDEFSEHRYFLSEDAGWLFGKSFKGFHETRHDYPEDLQDFRWVFWFDN